MARKKKHGAHENHERWLVSYADFITLLFAFFVVMFASAQSDKGKAAEVSESIREALAKGNITAVVANMLGTGAVAKDKKKTEEKGEGGGTSGTEGEGEGDMAELLPSLELLTAELQPEIGLGQLQLHLEPRGLVISLRQAAYFPSGNDSVDQATWPSLEKIAHVIRKIPNPVRFEGHTDSVPIHNLRFRSNWDLSAARAIAVLDLFKTRFEIPENRLSVAGYAETAPLEPNTTETGRASNRRVDIVILNQMGAGGEPKKDGGEGHGETRATGQNGHGDIGHGDGGHEKPKPARGRH